MVDSSFRITFRNRERKTLQATVISPDIITIKGVNTDEKYSHMVFVVALTPLLPG